MPVIVSSKVLNEIFQNDFFFRKSGSILDIQEEI